MKSLAFLVAVGAGVTLSGQAPQQAPPVLGVGATLCREWTGKDTQVHNPENNSWSMTMSPKDPEKVSWVMGYLSAVGVSGDALARSGGVRAEGYILGRVSGACFEAPERTLASVVADLGNSR